jgi:hypothetical protein
MGVLVGRRGAVLLGTYRIAEIGTWKMNGVTRDTIDVTPFGSEDKLYEFGLSDGGTITFSGSYDNTDSTGQALLDSACQNGSAISLKFMINSTSGYVPDTTGNSSSRMLVTKCRSIDMSANGVGKIDFEVKISGRIALV